jgi:nucleoside-diphosphate-sugar epimerase
VEGPVLVSGASGFLGRHLLEAQRAEDERPTVLALVRDAESWRRFEWTAALTHVEPLDGSVTEPERWSTDERLKGLKGIFHLAAVVRHSRWETGDIYETNVLGTLHMVRLAAAHGCRMVFVSTSGTVGCFRSAEEWADESSPYCDSEVSAWPYYHSKIVAERKARDLAKELGVDLVILRPPILLGPRDHKLRSSANVLRFLERRFPFLIRGGIHFTDVRDAAGAMSRAMSRPRARPVYHLAGTACSIEHFFGMLEEISGVPAPRIVLPFRPAWLLASAAQRLGILLKGEPLRVLPDPVVIEMAARYWDIHSLYAAEELAYTPRDGRETLADTVHWLRETQGSLD